MLSDKIQAQKKDLSRQAFPLDSLKADMERVHRLRTLEARERERTDATLADVKRALTRTETELDRARIEVKRLRRAVDRAETERNETVMRLSAVELEAKDAGELGRRLMRTRAALHHVLAHVVGLDADEIAQAVDALETSADPDAVGAPVIAPTVPVARAPIRRDKGKERDKGKVKVKAKAKGKTKRRAETPAAAEPAASESPLGGLTRLCRDRGAVAVHADRMRAVRTVVAQLESVLDAGAQLTCLACLGDAMVDARVLACGHAFCLVCVRTMLACNVCDAPVGSALHPCAVLDELAAKAQMQREALAAARAALARQMQ